MIVPLIPDAKRALRIPGPLPLPIVRAGSMGAGSNRKHVFRCPCGAEFEAYLHNVREFKTRSCGCVRRRPDRNFPTAAQLQILREMATDRRTQHEIAGAIGVVQSTVGKLFKRYGIAPMTRTEGRAASMARIS